MVDPTGLADDDLPLYGTSTTTIEGRNKSELNLNDIDAIHSFCNNYVNQYFDALPDIDYKSVVEGFISLGISQIPGVGPLFADLYNAHNMGLSMKDNTQDKTANKVRDFLVKNLLITSDNADTIKNGNFKASLVHDWKVVSYASRTGPLAGDVFRSYGVEHKYTLNFEYQNGENSSISFSTSDTWRSGEAQLNKNPLSEYLSQKFPGKNNGIIYTNTKESGMLWFYKKDVTYMQK